MTKKKLCSLRYNVPSKCNLILNYQSINQGVNRRFFFGVCVKTIVYEKYQIAPPRNENANREKRKIIIVSVIYYYFYFNHHKPSRILIFVFINHIYKQYYYFLPLCEECASLFPFIIHGPPIHCDCDTYTFYRLIQLTHHRYSVYTTTVSLYIPTSI